ncbi:hypothetical protein [Thermogutta sp.]|uniref:hypothetical protein n=1 Tax=Thermogutta sp. TaxID=1962930 RepID=UPI00321FDB83
MLRGEVCEGFNLTNKSNLTVAQTQLVPLAGSLWWHACRGAVFDAHRCSGY